MAERERIQRDIPEMDMWAPEEKGKAKQKQKKNREKGEHKKKEQAQKQFESDQEDLKIV